MTDENSGTENKVIFLGEAGVGKSSLIKVSIGEKFDKAYNSSISLSFFSKEVNYNNKKYFFNLWDTIGQEKYRSLTKIFYKKSKIVIFVYDITNKVSFENLEFWINSVNEELGNEKYIKAIVGNKSDLYLQEEVNEGEAKQFAISKGAKFIKCSAKDNPLDFIKFLDELCIEVIQQNEGNNREESISLDRKAIKKDKKSCNC